jgi:hypothetical protein
MGVAARLPSSLSLSTSRFGVALAPRFRMGVFRLYSLRAEPGGGSGGVFGLGGVLCRFPPAELSRVSEPARSSLSAPCIVMGLSGQSPVPDTPPSIAQKGVEIQMLQRFKKTCANVFLIFGLRFKVVVHDLVTKVDASMDCQAQKACFYVAGNLSLSVWAGLVPVLSMYVRMTCRCICMDRGHGLVPVCML